MKIYLAGKVSGTDIAASTIKFGQAQHDIEQMGVEAINPLEVVNDWHTTWNAAMRKCIAAMMTADMVLLLPDWKESNGARIEKILAEDLGIPVYDNIRAVKYVIEEMP